ncbi:hypothetical protein D3C87_1937200 [compost metagenome]
MSVLALMTLGMQMAHADGAGNALRAKNLTCEVTLRDGSQVKINTPVSALDVEKARAGSALVELRQSSGNLTITVTKVDGSSEVIGGAISGHGYFAGNTTGAEVACAVN